MHELVLTTSPEGWTLECPECSRLIVIPRNGQLNVLVKGDQLVQHIGGSPGLAISVTR